MAIRYIDTNFFKSPFVRSLEAPLKTLYSFIICDCSGAGIWSKDLQIASVYIGYDVTENDWNIFINCGKAIDLQNGKYFFPDFIEHQYPKGLGENNPAHKNFIKELKKYDLLDANLKIKTIKYKDPIKTLKRVISNSKGNSSSESNSKGNAEVLIWPTFEDFWNLYDKKISKPNCEKKWNKLEQKTKDKIMNYILEYKKEQPDKKYRKNPETFLNNKSWNDEIIKKTGNTDGISHKEYVEGVVSGKY